MSDPAEKPDPIEPAPETPPADQGMGGIFQQASTRAYNTAHREQPLTEVKTDEDYANLKAGAKFVGPDKQTRVKPYEVTSDEEFDALPEGVEFRDPKGELRKKPVSKDVTFTAQMLHDMAQTPEAKEQALKVIYGDKVKRDSLGHLYVEDEGGAILTPKGRGLMAGLGAQAAEAAPAIGMVGVGLLGAAGGTAAEPGGGTVLGGMGGAILGAAAGRQVNNVVLGLAGVHQDLGTQASSLAREAAGVAGGEVVGRGLTKVAGAIGATRRGAEDATKKLGGVRENLPGGAGVGVGVTPARARRFLGTTPEMADQAADITGPPASAETKALEESGELVRGRVPPSVLFPESPFLKKVEQFDATFRAQNVFAQANEDYYNKQVNRILQETKLGVSLDELATKATKKVSSERAGQLALDAARKDMAQADAELENAVRDLKTGAEKPIVEAGGPEKVAQLRTSAMERLQAAQERAKTSAEQVIQVAMKGLREDIGKVFEMVKANDDPSALHRKIAAEFQMYNQGVRQRAKLLYRAADEAAGDSRIDTTSLSNDAAAFLRTMPETLRAKYPGEINDLKKLAPEVAGEAEGASDAAEPVEALTFGQLHHLRSWFRYGIDYNDLTPDMRGGALKHFERKINAVIHDANAPEQLKAAASMLDHADGFYKENIPFLSDQMVQGTIDILRSGAGANPTMLAGMFFDPERTAAMRKVRGIVGENLWKGVQAAHVEQMLDKSKIIGSDSFDASKFAQQIEDLDRNGLLSTAYDEMTAKRLTKIATDIKRLGGALPITAEPGDTVSMLMRKAQIAAQEVEKFAELDPIKALSKEMKRINQQYSQVSKQTAKDRKAEPLHFLYEDSMSALATKAADRILGSQDLIMAAAQQFGRESPEFKGLQQVYAARFFQRPFGRTAKMREELGGERGMTEEVQALMFPGVTRKMMNQLADNMEFLFSGGGSDVGGSMAAASRVLNPLSSIPLPQPPWIMKVPLIGTGARYVLSQAFALTMDATSHPNFINWLAGRLSGDAAARAEARAVVQQRMAAGGWYGRAIGQQLTTQRSAEPQQ